MTTLNRLKELITKEIKTEDVNDLVDELIEDIQSEKIHIKDYLNCICHEKHTSYNGLLVLLMYQFMPSYKHTKQKDDQFYFLHSVDAKLRQKDSEFINKCLLYIDHHIVGSIKHNALLNIIYNVAITFSGLSDELGLTYVIKAIEEKIDGFIPIHQLETYDDDPSDSSLTDPQFPTAAFIRVVSMILICFDKMTLKSFLDHFAVKDSDNIYNLERMWLTHSNFLTNCLNLNHVELIDYLNVMFVKHKIITKKMPLKINLYSAKIPNYLL